MDARHVFPPVLVLVCLACGPLRAAAQGPSPGADASAVPGAIATGPDGRLVGRVTDGRGLPIDGIVITADAFLSQADDGAVSGPATAGEDAVTPAGRTTTDADGMYALDDLPPGSIWLRAADPQARYLGSYYPAAPRFAESTPIRLPSGATIEGIDFALAAGSWLRGVVRAAASPSGLAPMAGVQVAAFRGDDVTSPFATALSGSDGRFTFGPLPPGDYRLRAGGPAGAWFAAAGATATDAAGALPITLADGIAIESVDLSMPTGAPPAWSSAPDGASGATEAAGGIDPSDEGARRP